MEWKSVLIHQGSLAITYFPYQNLALVPTRKKITLVHGSTREASLYLWERLESALGVPRKRSRSDPPRHFSQGPGACSQKMFPRGSNPEMHFRVTPSWSTLKERNGVWGPLPCSLLSLKLAILFTSPGYDAARYNFLG